MTKDSKNKPKMKRIFIKLASIFLSGLGFYNCCEANSNAFYAGGGISTLISNNTLRLFRPNTGTFHTTHDMGNAFGAQLLLGYQRLFANQQYLAAEAGLRGTIGRSSGELFNYNINTPRVSVPISTTISLKPGFILAHNNFLYGLLGVAVSRISMYQRYSNFPLKVSRWRPGLLFGVGVQQQLNNKYSVSLNYDYEWYNPIFKYFPANNFFDKLQPRNQVISLNIIETIC